MENIIEITESACLKIKSLINDEGFDDTYFLRVSVKGGGCSGLRYELSFENKVQDGDVKSIFNDVTVICDKMSVLYLIGTILDYSGGLNGKGFTFTNPQSVRVCGCGQSFSI